MEQLYVTISQIMCHIVKTFHGKVKSLCNGNNFKVLHTACCADCEAVRHKCATTPCVSRGFAATPGDILS